MANYRRSMLKPSWGNTFVCWLLQGIWWNTEQILLVCSLLKETITAIMMLYKNMKAIVCSPGSDTNFFNIVARVLQGDTLASYLSIICLDYVLWTSIDLIKNKMASHQKKARNRRYPAETIIDADYADDLALLSQIHLLKLNLCCIVWFFIVLTELR